MLKIIDYCSKSGGVEGKPPSSVLHQCHMLQSFYITTFCFVVCPCALTQGGGSMEKKKEKHEFATFIKILN